MATAATHQPWAGFGLHASATPAEDHIANFWRARIDAMLAKLESEARRMFQLEAELSNFANEYYNAVGAATERLAAVEERFSAPTPTTSISYSMTDIISSRDAGETRKREIKHRYRALAKEIHPDRASLTQGIGVRATQMHALNAAYQTGDLAGMLRLEAEIVLSQQIATDCTNVTAIEQALRDLDRAAQTYADSYRAMLNSPINELMLRAMSARLAGWDWMEAVVRKVERTIEQKERAMIEASIAEISQWRAQVQAAA